MGSGSGGMAVPERVKRGSKATKRKKKKRIGFTLDMTPLVDVAFLLLTFFMYTTTMVTPQIMEMNVPREETEIDVNENNLYTIQILGSGKIFKSLGTADPEMIDLKTLKDDAVNMNLLRKNDLITVLKTDPDLPFGTYVSVLDMLNQAEGDIINRLRAENIMKRERKFTIVKMTDEEKAKLKTL